MVIDAELKKDFQAMNGVRRRGKHAYLVPEQFTDEWDWLRASPGESNSETAGNFDFHTNLYQVANVGRAGEPYHPFPPNVRRSRKC